MDSSTAGACAAEAMRLADVDPRSAPPLAARALERARLERDLAAASLAEQAWGHALLQCGEVGGAIRHLQRAVAHSERLGSSAAASQARMKLAFALTQRGRPASALAEVNRALVGLDGVPRARTLAQRAVVLYQIGRYEQAAADYDAAVPVLRDAGDRLAVQRILLNRGILFGERNRFAEANADLWQADRLARELGRHLAVGIIAENLGFVASRCGDVPAALAHLDRAERIIAEHHGQLAPVLQDRGELLLSIGLISEAREVAGRAVAAFRQERRQLKVPEMLLMLAQAAFLEADWASAVASGQQAAREFGRQQRAEWATLARLAVLRARLAAGERPRDRLDAITGMAQVLARNGWSAAALEARLAAAQVASRRGLDGRGHLIAAQRAARRGPAALRARGWYARALLRQAGGDRRGATVAARAGLRVLDEHHAALGASDLRAHSAVHRTELVRFGLETALESGRPALVFEWAERGRARQLQRRAARPPDDRELADLLVQLRTVASQADRQPSPELARRQVSLERRVRDHRRLRPSEHDAPLPEPIRVGALSAALGGWGLVEFVQTDGDLMALTVAGRRLRMRPLGPAAAIAALAERLPFALRRLSRSDADPAATAAAVALLRSAASRLDSALLGPLPELSGRPLVVVPTGVLHSVPWSVLPSCAGRPVTVSPSATLWHSATTCRSDRSAGAIVAAGPSLHGAREEALRIGEIHGVRPLVDGAASADAVLSALAGASLAHLAAHGRLALDNPLFSELLLADGPLVVYDLERLARAPHTVVLAACDSGRSKVCPGDELLGLAAMFIERGSAQLVASVAPVPDAETAPLMVSFHSRLAAGDPPAAALATAQQDLTSQHPPAPVLAAAAGFVCIGAGRNPGAARTFS